MRSVRWKVFIPVFALILLFTLVISLITSKMTRDELMAEFGAFSESYVDEIYNLVDQFHDSSVVIENLKISETQKRLNNLVEGPMSLLADFYAMEQSGELSRAAAQSQAISIIRDMRYDSVNYFWIDTTEYINVILPPNTSWEGQSRAEVQDKTGQYIVRDLVDGAVAEGTFTYEYYFPKPGETEASPKMGLVHHFEPWGWVIGTGEYIDNIQADLAAYEAEQLQKLNDYLYSTQILGSYPFIKDRESTYIAYVNREKVGVVSPSFDKVSGEDLTAQYFALGEVTEKGAEISYMWTKSGEPEGKFFKKIGYIRYFEPRDWIIVFSSYESDLIEQSRQIQKVILSVGILMSIVTGLIALFIINLVTKALKITSQRLEEIAEGDADLTQRLKVRNKDETGRLAQGFNGFVESLQRIMQNVRGASSQGREVAETLASNVEEISATLDEIQATVTSIDTQSDTLADLANGVKEEIGQVGVEVSKVNHQASEEAAAVEQSSAAVEEMVASIQSISNIAENRVVLADTLASMARSGEEQMETTLKDIDGIATSADAIRDVVTVIDSISSQINLLAMNAAIEAAHAGDAGRGFAVVADEIRKLAESTGENSKRIGDSVVDIVDRIGETSERSRQTGESISRIVIDSSSVSAALTEILNALQELGRGTEQITEALTSLVGASAAVKESTKAIEEKSDQTNSALGQVADLSRQNHEAIAEISRAMMDITKALSDISSLGGKNLESLDVLDGEIRRFTL